MDSVTIDLEDCALTTEEADLVEESGVSSFNPFKDLQLIYLKSMSPSSSPSSSSKSTSGISVLNSSHEEIFQCPIPKLEERTAQQQCFPLNDLKGHTILNATRALQAINFTSGNHANALGSLKTPNFGRSFHFRTIYGISLDIQIDSCCGDIFCCPCAIRRFRIVSHLDQSTQVGQIKFDRADEICEIDLRPRPSDQDVSNEEVHLSEKNTALFVLAAIVLFEWYFRKSELGFCGARGSLCCCGYILFSVLLAVIVMTAGILLFKHWHLL